MDSMIAVVLVMFMLSGGALAQSSGCTSAIVGLAPCLDYIQGSSSTPSSSCCSQLSSVVKSQPECLCEVVNGGGYNFGITIDKNQALALPGACKVQTPPVSRCNNNAANRRTGSPAAAGAESPANSPTSSPADASTPEGSVTPDAPTSPTDSDSPSTGSGSKSSTGNTSDGSMTKISLHSAVFLLFISSFASAIIAF